MRYMSAFSYLSFIFFIELEIVFYFHVYFQKFNNSQWRVFVYVFTVAKYKYFLN